MKFHLGSQPYVRLSDQIDHKIYNSTNPIRLYKIQLNSYDSNVQIEKCLNLRLKTIELEIQHKIPLL